MARRKFLKYMKRKLALVFILVMLVFLGLVCRITYINAAKGDKYKKTVLDQQQYNSRQIAYKRGDILDRNGTKIALSERVYNVILDAKILLGDEDYIEKTLEIASTCFEIPVEEMEAILEETPESRYAILKKDVDYNTATTFTEMMNDEADGANSNGIWLEEDYIRKYPYNATASDVIGFVNDEDVGSYGLESYYNDVLTGVNGKEYGYLDEDATFNRTVKEPVNGSNVVSTIDLQIQSIVDRYVLEFNDAQRDNTRPGEGSLKTNVLVMNPQNGEILAMTDFPSYDLNNRSDLSRNYTPEDQQALRDEGSEGEVLAKLWSNACVSDSFEPGSTFKEFTVAGALDSGVLNGEETFYCGGMLHVGDHDIYCNNTKGHGTQTLSQAMANSCNVALMEIGLRMGAEGFTKMQSNYGFGQYTGIDLPGEAETAGLIHGLDDIQEVDIATSSFGQSFNVTMVQLASAFSSLINGGDYYKPHLVKEIQDEQGTVTTTVEPEILKKTTSKETSDLVKTYLREVVVSGTGAPAAVEGYDIGGKTGTAEKLPRGHRNYVVSFIGYAPQENPQVVIYIAIDEPNTPDQQYGQFTTKMFAGIASEIFPYLGVEKVQ
ncbi:peptidoglycan D,D-transpeptidase FtsI family protein [Ohessyouella blattaphilus]